MSIKASDYNKIPENLVVNMERDEIVRYRLLGIKRDPVPENRGREIIPFSKNVPAVDQVLDPKTGDVIELAFIRRVQADGSAALGHINFTLDNSGYIVLRGNRPNDKKIFQYLELCSYNRDSKVRNPSVKPVFYRVDKSLEAAQRSSERRLVLEALTLATEMEESDLREIGMILGMPSQYTDSVDAMRDWMENYAEDDPDTFKRAASKDSSGVEALLREAVQKGVLEYRQAARKIFFGEDVVFSYPATFGFKVYEEFAYEIRSRNPELISNIKKALALKDEGEEITADQLANQLDD
jgi:hypothetical protein